MLLQAKMNMVQPTVYMLVVGAQEEPPIVMMQHKVVQVLPYLLSRNYQMANGVFMIIQKVDIYVQEPQITTSR